MKNGVKVIQAAAYNDARTVSISCGPLFCEFLIHLICDLFHRSEILNIRIGYFISICHLCLFSVSLQIVLELKDPPSAESEVGSILRCFVHKLGLANRVSSKLLAVKKVEGSKGTYFLLKQS